MRGKRIITILCLILCLVSGVGAGNARICASGQEKAEDKGQDGTDSQVKQGTVESTGTGGLVIDNQNIYEGMENSYSGGYTPKSDGKKVVVVLPLLAKRKLAGNQMTVTLRFGESENLPFVQKNYEKTVSYGMHSTGNSAKKTGCYLVTFGLELKKERYNGNYPVILSVSAEDEEGNEISQEFTVYVTISDGKELDALGKSDASETGSTTGLVIDNKKVYKGMGKSYSQGYTPKTDGTKAVIVLPLLAKRTLSGGKLTAALKLGEAENQPFVQKNYEKTVKAGKKTGCYLVSFNLKLKKKRYNGSYPVTISVHAEDKEGNEISQEFTVYVIITDGKSTEGDSGSKGGDKVPSPAPKIRMASYQFSKDKVLCGERFTAKLSLVNTSRTEAIKNMMVTVAPGENVELLGKTDNAYVEELGIGKKCIVSFDFRVNASAPGGQYSIGVTMNYADSKGNDYNIEESVKVSADQKVRIGIDPVQVPREIQLGETVILQTQAMNLGKGKLYNVRAVLEADGLSPVSSAYMGDVEAGTSLSGSLEVVAEGLSGETLYGNTQGKLIFYYEDELGNEMTEEQEFETAILSPFKEDEEKKPEDSTGQWWIIMAAIAAFLGLSTVVLFIKKKKKAQMGEGEPDGN